MSVGIHLLQPSITVLSSCVCSTAHSLHTGVPAPALPQASHESKLAWARGMGIEALGKVQAITFVSDQLRLLFRCVVKGDRQREGVQLDGWCLLSSTTGSDVLYFCCLSIPPV